MDATRIATLRRLDEAHLLHPFTDHVDLHRQGTHVIEEAAGCHVVDETGRRLLDGLAGLWCVNVGYGRREITDAVHRQMTSVAFYRRSSTPPPSRPSDWRTRSPPWRRAAWARCSSRTPAPEANETALKLIRAYRSCAGARPSARSSPAPSATTRSAWRPPAPTGLPSCTEPFDLPLDGFLRVTRAARASRSATWRRRRSRSGSWPRPSEVIAREGADTIAALFAEPHPGRRRHHRAAARPPARAARHTCRRHDILFVADEVIRLRPHRSVVRVGAVGPRPDLLTMAKGITSGYVPLGGVDQRPTGRRARARRLPGTRLHLHRPPGGHRRRPGQHRDPRARRRSSACATTSALLPAAPARQRRPSAVGEVRGEELIGAIELVPRGAEAARPTPPALGAPRRRPGARGSVVRGIRDLIAKIAPPLIIARGDRRDVRRHRTRARPFVGVMAHGFVPALGYHWLTRLYDPLLAVTLREARPEAAAHRPGGTAPSRRCSTSATPIPAAPGDPAPAGLSGARVVELDADPNVLALARRKIDAAGLDIELRRGVLAADTFRRRASTGWCRPWCPPSWHPAESGTPSSPSCARCCGPAASSTSRTSARRARAGRG
ncbi:MAG: aminotransferase class III-fold pyridoxal phosphate-dependent enzyme [Candidatus Binatia bacterium]